MIVSTTDCIPGLELKKILGIARGNVVQSKHIGKDIMAGLKGIVGGTGKAGQGSRRRRQSPIRAPGAPP